MQERSADLAEYVADHPHAFGGLYYDNEKDEIVILTVDDAPAAARDAWDSLVPTGA